MIGAKRELSRPGTWIGIPLPNGGFALGLIARRAESRKRSRKIFVYLFGPRSNDLSDLKSYLNRAASECLRFGFTWDQEVLTGRWPVIGKVEDFRPDDWPIPLLKRGPFGGGPDYKRRFTLYKMEDDLSAERLHGPQEQLIDDPGQYGDPGTHGYISFEQFAERIVEGNPFPIDM